MHNQIYLGKTAVFLLCPLNEIILDEYLQCSVLGTIIFFEVDFRRIDFTGSTFVNCLYKKWFFSIISYIPKIV